MSKNVSFIQTLHSIASRFKRKYEESLSLTFLIYKIGRGYICISLIDLWDWNGREMLCLVLRLREAINKCYLAELICPIFLSLVTHEGIGVRFWPSPTNKVFPNEQCVQDLTRGNAERTPFTVFGRERTGCGLNEHFRNPVWQDFFLL